MDYPPDSMAQFGFEYPTRAVMAVRFVLTVTAATCYHAVTIPVAEVEVKVICHTFKQFPNAPSTNTYILMLLFKKILYSAIYTS